MKCPVCGAGMYGNKSIKRKKDGTKYKDFYYYGCKHRTMTRGHKCDYKRQIREELLDDAVAEVIVKLVSNPRFADMMQQKINRKVDTSAIEQEIANYEKQLRQSYSVKAKIMEEIDSLDPDDRHYIRRKADLDDRLYRMYDKIEETENLLIEARAKKTAIEAEKITGDNIYKVLIYFDRLYKVMNDIEKRQLMESLVSEIQIFEDRQPNGQWLKSIKFRLPIIEEDMEVSLDDDEHVKTLSFDVNTENESYKDKDGNWKSRFKGYQYRHTMKIEFPSDRKRLGNILYLLANHTAIRPEFRFSFFVGDVEASKNELLGKAVADAKEKAAVLAGAAGCALKSIVSIDYSWGEIELEVSPYKRTMLAKELAIAPDEACYEMDIEPDDVEMCDTVTIVWSIE